jgi:hypothetical protein
VIFDPLLDLFRGKAVTVPPMDGAFRPNAALDEAQVVIEVEAPDNLASDDFRLLFSTGCEVRAIQSPGKAPEVVLQGQAQVSALAAGAGQAMAVAFEDGGIVIRGGPRDVKRLGAEAFDGLACPTAMAFEDENTLLVAQGSRRHRPSDWAIDLMEKGASGSVWRVDLATDRAMKLADGLAFPNGLLARPEGIIVSESWKHRLLAMPRGGGAQVPILEKLPGYPARMSPASDGGAWLALFAPRNRLIEFVLLEDEYRRQMMREVPRECWIAPALFSNRSFLEPLQCGGVKTMGIHKPWSPSRSYGLVARLDQRLRPVASYHSRANGQRHGVTSVTSWKGRAIVAAKGGDAILDVGRV